MRTELDAMLCEKYPKLFKNRNADMQETAMCWGFECGDGWYHILDTLCRNIQGHIDWKEQQRESALKYNKIAQAGKDGNTELFESLIAEEYKKFDQAFVLARKEEMLEDPLREVPEVCPQVTVDQVKEKFGTLRFYYTGGDAYIRGLSDMAESMSGITCEVCGKPGERRGGGWVSTLCDEHAKS